MNGNEPGTNSTLHSKNTWRDLSQLGINATDRLQVHHAGYWMDYETHGGEDVPVYATGIFFKTNLFLFSHSLLF